MSARSAAIAAESASIDASQGRAIAARERESAVAQPTKMTAIESLAARLNVSSSSLQTTLKNTAFKGCTDAEFVMLVIISNTYELNPLLREIYAFPKKGGGIQAIVGYDGWIRIANRHEQFDGLEFDHIEDGNGNLKAVEGILWRKDRSRPVKKMLYLKEFKRNTEPWNNSPNHMLDVRCFCHTVRLGLGVSLGVEGDENLDVDQIDVGGEPTVLPTRKSLAEELNDEIPAFDKKAEQVDTATGEVIEDAQAEPVDSRGMSEVDEETARQLDAGGDAVEQEAEEAEISEVEEQGADNTPLVADFSGEKPTAAEVNQTWWDGETLRYAHHTQNGLKWYPQPQEPGEQVKDASASPKTDQVVDAAAEPAEEQPAWAAMVAELRMDIEAANTLPFLKTCDDEFVKIRAGLPDEVINELDGKLAAKRAALRGDQG